ANTRLTIHWSQRMLFDGKYAQFRGGVMAYQDNAKLKCQELEVTLDRLVSFKEGPKENQNAQVEKLVCHGHVWVIDEKVDAIGKRVQCDRLVATELDLNNQEGPIRAAGPLGRFEHLAPGAVDVFAPSETRPQDGSAKEPPVMKLTRILFDGRMFSNS